MELKLPPEPDRNKLNGQFVKGRTSWNKGKKLKDYLSPEKYQKVISSLSRKGNPYIYKYGVRKEVIAFKDGKRIGIFESSEDAARKLNVIGRNIRHVCAGERNHAGGYQFFWLNDYDKYKDML